MKNEKTPTIAILALISVAIYLIADMLIDQFDFSDAPVIQNCAWFIIIVMNGANLFRKLCLWEIKKKIIYRKVYRLSYNFPPLSTWLIGLSYFLAFVLALSWGLNKYAPSIFDQVLDFLNPESDAIFDWPALSAALILAVMTYGGSFLRFDALFQNTNIGYDGD